MDIRFLPAIKYHNRGIKLGSLYLRLPIFEHMKAE